MSENVKQSLRILLSEIVDYAGLFPPSELLMAAAVENYAAYLKSEHGWMLGRFICPVARLEELSQHADRHFSSKRPWRISALAATGGDLKNDLEKIEHFNQAHEGGAVIDTIEIKAALPEDIERAARLLPEEINAYFEIPLKLYINELVSEIAVNRVRAKIRTGGLTQEAFPPVDELVKFLRVCVAANLPFKATAGLHHPLRSVRPLTYDDNAPTGTMHGFLNLFLTAAFLRQNLNAPYSNRIMTETEIANFEFTDEGVTWNGEQQIDLQQIRLMRERNAISFGSCSFVEPVEDLQQLGLL
jgi:hypothetical protein